MKKDARPVNLNLASIRFPSTAIVSILHRASGVLLCLAIPLLVWVLQQSLNSYMDFNALKQRFLTLPFKLLLLVLLSGLIYHIFAGIRHFCMDCGFFETKLTGKMSAWIVFLLSLLSIVWLGVNLW